MNIISYSLWGKNPIYWAGALKNIELARKYFPGWVCRFYIDQNSDKNLIESIKGENVEIVLVSSKGSFHGMFWRFYASTDPETDIFLSRDCDSRLCERELLAVNEWLDSSKDFHIMRDHPQHNVPILGGMWGCRNGILRKANLNKLINDWGVYDKKGADQFFLGIVVYPIIKDYALEHSDFDIVFGNELKPFPCSRKNHEFVGDIFDEKDNRDPNLWKLIQ